MFWCLRRGPVPEIWAGFHWYSCESSDTLPPPCPYAWYAAHCCPGGSACRPACTEVSLRKESGEQKATILIIPFFFSFFLSCSYVDSLSDSRHQTLWFAPERSSCSSESFSRLTLSSKALLTYSCCSRGVCFTALGLAQAWDRDRNTWECIHVKIIIM